MCAWAPRSSASVRPHLSDRDPGLRRKPRQEPPQRRRRQGDAAGRRPKAGARDMDEDGAAASPQPRPGIVIDLDDKIVKCIRTPQPVPGRPVGEPDRPVAAAIGRILAPGVAAAGAAHRQAGRGSPRSVGPPPQSNRAKSSARRRPVAFALERHQAGAPQRDRKTQRAGHEPAAVRTVAGPQMNAKCAPGRLPQSAILMWPRRAADGFSLLGAGKPRAACSLRLDWSTSSRTRGRDQPPGPRTDGEFSPNPHCRR